MAQLILRVRTESCWWTAEELAPKRFDLIKYKNGDYVVKYFILNELHKRASGQQKVNPDKVEKLLNRISNIKISASPDYDIGCDGGYTELESIFFKKNFHYRWWSLPPKGWEVLDEVAKKIIDWSRLYDNC